MKRIALALGLLLLCALPAAAWPDRPVRLIVGFQAGGSTDVVARLLADRLRSQTAKKLSAAMIAINNSVVVNTSGLAASLLGL